MKQRLILLVTCFFLILSSLTSAQVDRSKEVAALMTGLDSFSRLERITSAKKITQLGLTDPVLYEKVADLLRAGYAADTEPTHLNEMDWLCKALAASGDTKYQELLQEVATQAPHHKLKKYARESIDSIAKYQERNRVLNATEAWDASLSADENRLVSMLNADDNNLKREAAKIITRQSQKVEKVYDLVSTMPADDSNLNLEAADTIVRNSRLAKKIYDSAATALIKILNSGAKDRLSIDTMAWLCKALAASGDQKYKATLEQVTSGTSNSKLVRSASAALRNLY